jgi:hypothetical protein
MLWLLVLFASTLVLRSQSGEGAAKAGLAMSVLLGWFWWAVIAVGVATAAILWFLIAKPMPTIAARALPGAPVWVVWLSVAFAMQVALAVAGSVVSRYLGGSWDQSGALTALTYLPSALLLSQQAVCRSAKLKSS